MSQLKSKIGRLFQDILCKMYSAGYRAGYKDAMFDLPIYDTNGLDKVMAEIGQALDKFDAVMLRPVEESPDA